jgi:nitroreductase
MDMLELIKTRRSVRSYATTPVEEEKVAQILEAGRWAPSASNMQPWEFIVVMDKEMRKKVADNATYISGQVLRVDGGKQAWPA